MHCLLMTRVISDDQGDTREISGLKRSCLRSEPANMFTITDCSTPVHFRMAEDDNESKATAAF